MTMTKNAGLSSNLLSVASYFIIFAIYMGSYLVFVPLHANTFSNNVKIENAISAAYTPALRAGG